MEVPLLTWGIVLVGPVVALGVALYASVQTDVKELRENWVQYRCSPIYMPFASWINPDVSTEENFMTCMNMFGQAVMDGALDVVYSLFDVVMSIVGDLESSTNVVRGVFVKITNVMLTVVGGVFGKLFNGMDSLLQLLSRLRDVNSRITGSSWYLAFIAETSISMIMSVVNFAYSLVKGVVIAMFAISLVLALFYPPILAFAVTLGAAVGVTYCFDPTTQVELATGNPVEIQTLSIGDVLAGGSVVQGILRFRMHDKVTLYELDGITVSGMHKIYHANTVSHVSDHPDARKTPHSPDELICLITSDHRIRIRGITGTMHVFADYEEDLDPEVMSAIETLTWGYRVGAPGLPGFCENTLVPMAEGPARRIEDVRIGDVLACGAIVDGLVRHAGSLQDWIVLDDIAMTESQPIWFSELPYPVLVRDDPAVEARTPTGDAYSLVLRNSDGWFAVECPFGVQYTVRDYLESHDEDILLQIETLVLKSLTGKNAD